MAQGHSRFRPAMFNDLRDSSWNFLPGDGDVAAVPSSPRTARASSKMPKLSTPLSVCTIKGHAAGPWLRMNKDVPMAAMPATMAQQGSSNRMMVWVTSGLNRTMAPKMM